MAVITTAAVEGTAAEADIGDTGPPGIAPGAGIAHLDTAEAADIAVDSGTAAVPEGTASDLGIAVADTASAGMAPELDKAWRRRQEAHK